MTKVKILELVKWIRKQPELEQTKVLFGGPDVTYNWENYLKYGADFLVVGEGEQTFFELARELKEGKRFDQVDGLVFKNEKGEFIKNKPRTKAKEVDEFSFPNRKKIDLSKYLSV